MKSCILAWVVELLSVLIGDYRHGSVFYLFLRFSIFKDARSLDQILPIELSQKMWNLLACQVSTRVSVDLPVKISLFVAPLRLEFGFQRPDGRLKDRLLLR